MTGRRRLGVAVLTSRRAPGLEALLAHARSDGAGYSVEVVVASDPAFGSRGVVVETGVPFIEHDLRAFCAAAGTRFTDLVARAGYDARTATLLEPYAPDVVVCCGYLNVLTEPMLSAFSGRIMNIHDADLALPGDDGKPRYTGLRSTRDAILAGERETRSTVHLVTPEVDAGPILLRSESFPVHPMVGDALAWGAMDLLKAYAYAQREWMMRACWGDLLHETLLSWGIDGAAAPAGPGHVAMRTAGMRKRQLLEVA